MTFGGRIKSIKSVIDVFYTLIFYLIVTCAVHEMSHSLVGNLLGWQSFVSFPNPFSGWTSFPQWAIMPLSNVIIIAFAGGAITCLLMMLMSYFTEDWETDLILYFIIPMQGIYAIFEIGYILRYFDIMILGTLPSLLALPITFWLIKRHHD